MEYRRAERVAQCGELSRVAQAVLSTVLLTRINAAARPQARDGNIESISRFRRHPAADPRP
jgi:hypothetical protein